jgi:uncharacterized membrane protein YphA (DoxX/SURF4 family)
MEFLLLLLLFFIFFLQRFWTENANEHKLNFYDHITGIDKILIKMRLSDTELALCTY